MPLYQRITGLGINVKIDVFPSRPIPRKLSSHFLDELKNIYSTSLSRYITLQIRHISVWFGPQGTKAQDKYYMFDLYLFNANETIDYSRAVNEVQDFFYDLKSHEKLSLLNGTEIGLNFKFNHRIESRGYSNRDTSVTAGGIMSPVVGSYFRHSRQTIRISNVNWCYRVAFAQFEDVNEVERLAPDAYLIKPANIIVYQTQYDFINIDQGLHRPFDPSRSHTSVISVLYMCLDLFVDQLGANSSDQANIVESFTQLNDRNDDNADGTTLGPIIIISVFGSLILLVSLYRSMKHTRPSDVSQGVGTGE